MAQDGAGYLWMTTRRGLNRFDGEKFIGFTIAQGVRQNHLTALTISDDDRIWAGDYGGGITIVQGEQVVRTVAPAPGITTEVTALLSLGPEVLLVGLRSAGLWKLTLGSSDHQWQAIQGLPETIDQLMADRQRIYLRADEQLWTAAVQSPEQFERNDLSVRRIGRSVAGQVGIATSRGEGLNASAPKIPAVPVSRNAAHVIPGQGTAQGIGFWQVIENRLTDPGGRIRLLPTSDILAMFVDREGIVWLGSSKGLIRFLGFRFSHYLLSDTRDGRLVWSIAQDRRGRYWFGTDDSLLLMDGGILRVLNESTNLPNGPVRDLHVDAQGVVWAAIRGRGLYQIQPDTLIARLTPGTEEMELLDLTETADGGLWMSSLRSGVLRLDRASGQLRRTQLGPNGGVFSIAASGPEEIWAGVNNVGVMVISPDDADGLKHHPLPGGQALISPFIGQITMTGRNSAWIGTTGGGVFRYQNARVENFASQSILAGQNIYVLEQLNDGSIVVGADTGLYQMDIKSRHIFRHQPLNGFVAIESNVHATFFDQNGDLWIGTVAGVSRMDQSMPLPTPPRTQVEIVQLQTGSGRTLAITEDPIRPDDGGLMVNFRAVSLLDPAQVEYSHRLVGLESNFSEPSGIDSVRYSSLGSGEFEFQVRSRLPGQPWSATALRQFTVLPPIWQRTWFLGLVALAIGLGFAAVIQLRTHQIASVNRRLREEVADRTRSIDEARKRLEESNRLLEYQANYDELTGLLNRRSFEKKLNALWSSPPQQGSHGYLMFMDLDQFKIVNDTCGHSAGDQLLCEVGDLISRQVESDDALGRLGGDEFGLIALRPSPQAAVALAEKVRLAIEELLFPWESQIFRIGISIGVVALERQRGDLSEVQQLADAACYAAKQAGRNQVHLVEGEQDLARAHQGEMRWVQRLHDAMENNRFALYGQKIAPLNGTGDEPERMEILLRMRDMVSQKLVPPGAFLPAAERYGLSVKLDEWVVTNLLKTLFVHESLQAEGRRYWVNLSGASVGEPKFCQSLLKLMAKSELPSGMVNFEITETAVIRSVSEAARLISGLKEMGCAFALDDFGSGLSSFGYLKRLQVDYLKIDGMFIRDIAEDETDRIFVKSIIDIAHSLNIKAIAEFVENDRVLEIVRSLGADYGQGFGIHRPELLMPDFPSRLTLSAINETPLELAGVTS